MAIKDLRRQFVTRPLFRAARKAMPSISDTERQALEAGEVWWDGELFSGNPDWQMLLDTPAPKLTEREQAFLDGPVEELIAMLDEWEINWHLRDLPEEAWQFIRENRFLGMIIPDEYGGLGFSAFAHSEVVRRIASRSTVAAVTVMVPNSLGAGELLLQFGTEEQRRHWLPRLADGRELPCFGLTSPQAGSDAASLDDVGIVEYGEYEGEEVLGIRLNWHKRYIALAPVATLIGLAFRLHDPDHLLSEEEDRGITVALVPAHLEGVDTGRRHIASFQMFQVGPTWGRDVFIPLDHVIGGREQVGQGWKMLMGALAAGRGISLPSLSAAGVAMAARTTGAYARVREQFGIPIGKFEGVQERLARLAAAAYLLDAARHLTCAGIEEGQAPAVVSAIIKTHATYRLRDVVNDAMDVHAGKAIIEGPLNYLSTIYRGAPVGVTVEGSNVLTRNLIIFGQGAIRCHPWLLQEMMALQAEDGREALKDFDRAFWGHVGHGFRTFGRAFLRSWTGGRAAPVPAGMEDHPLSDYYRQLGRYAAGFALCADASLITLGGALKRKEMLSARFADILSELYLLSSVLKRWEDDGRHQADLPLVHYCMAEGFAKIENRFDTILANLPARTIASVLRAIVQPAGARARPPSDHVVKACARILTEPGDARERLTGGIDRGRGDDGLARLERAFDLVHQAEPIREKLAAAEIEDWRDALRSGLMTREQADILEAAEEAVRAAIETDHYAKEELAPRGNIRSSAPQPLFEEREEEALHT